MERLTERLTDKSYCISDIRAIQKETFYEDMECRRGFDLYTGKAIDKLAEYEDLEEQNKLLKLPCAVGDTVYADSRVFGVLEYEVYNIVINKTITYQCSAYSKQIGDCSSECLDEIEADISEFGKTVFLTREEAEAALKELERGKGE